MLMRFHPGGLIVFGIFLLLALVGGAWIGVAVARFAVIVFAWPRLSKSWSIWFVTVISAYAAGS